ncbi:class I SAM-dependent methyltransferase [Dapis sp. BLCC M126]|uniref:class I SAM-dependent methyltransferase n=1 Tax=Dapis sp. BLCC M126 TaxID=3400189 RepID=UPI003CE6D86A
MQVKQSKCNICDGEEFIDGPGGRLSGTGLQPKCKKCGSLERHRAIRDFFIQLKKVSQLETYSCLQISSDLSIEPSWFDYHELSVYGSKNSIDIQNIERPDNSYDIAICNHVLEHVQDDVKALREILRILKPNGLLELSVPSPYYQKTTNDWGYPDNNQHGHYRVYGKDIENKFQQNINYPYLSCTIIDPVTEEKDILYAYSKSLQVLEKIKTMRDRNLYLTEIFVPNGYTEPKQEDNDIRYANLAERVVTPTNIPGWYLKTHVDFFNFMITYLPQQCTVLECGVFFGRSTIDVAKRLQLAGKKFHIFAVDSFFWGGWIKRENFLSEELRHEFDRVVSECGKDMLEIFRHYLLKYNFENVITPVKSLIVDYAEKVEDNSIDLCYIDSSHEYQKTINEINALLPKIKVGGWLCGDDYDKEAVKNAVLETIPQAKAWDNGRIWYLQIQE